MHSCIKTFGLVFVLTVIIIPIIGVSPAFSLDTAKIDRAVDAALKDLYAKSPAAVEVSKVAKGILVFPKVYKAGLLVGGEFGNGALRVADYTDGYYNTTAASYGLQIGAQAFGYALFFVTDDALNYLKKSDGWEIGVGPSVVIVDAGVGRTLSSTTLKESIYAFIFDQKGLMAGIGIRGAKITRLNP